jgi:hypothetical protein
MLQIYVPNRTTLIYIIYNVLPINPDLVDKPLLIVISSGAKVKTKKEKYITINCIHIDGNVLLILCIHFSFMQEYMLAQNISI